MSDDDLILVRRGDLATAQSAVDALNRTDGVAERLLVAVASPSFPVGLDEPPAEAVEDDDGWRLYQLLALFDTRDGSAMANLVRAAREGYERSGPDMGEDNAWNEFDALWEKRTVVVVPPSEPPKACPTCGGSKVRSPYPQMGVVGDDDCPDCTRIDGGTS